jgi:hypothetical protein
MSCRTEAGVERNTARAISTCVPRAATATRLLNRVLGVYGYSGFRRESKITREVDHKRRCGKFPVCALGESRATRRKRRLSAQNGLGTTNALASGKSVVRAVAASWMGALTTFP